MSAKKEICKAAMCVEIYEELGFDPSNAAFSPTLSAEAQAEFDKLCSGVCATCPVLEAAEAMAAARARPAVQ